MYLTIIKSNEFGKQPVIVVYDGIASKLVCGGEFLGRIILSGNATLAMKMIIAAEVAGADHSFGDFLTELATVIYCRACKGQISDDQLQVLVERIISANPGRLFFTRDAREALMLIRAVCKSGAEDCFRDFFTELIGGICSIAEEEAKD